MDKITPIGKSNGKKKTWEKREESEDGSYKEIKVEEVSNGFIKTITEHYRKGEEWEWETIKSIHTENPMEERSLADKLESFLKNE